MKSPAQARRFEDQLDAYLVTTPLSPSNDYSQLGVGTSLSGTGIETLTIATSAFSFDLHDLSPMRTSYNTASNNEFYWDYSIYTALGNVDLTFTDGVLTSMGGTLDIGVVIRFAGWPGGEFF